MSISLLLPVFVLYYFIHFTFTFKNINNNLDKIIVMTCKKTGSNGKLERINQKEFWFGLILIRNSEYIT